MSSPASNPARRLRRTESDPMLPAGDVAIAQSLIKRLQEEGNKFEGHRIRMIGRHVDENAQRVHKAIVYTTDVVDARGAQLQRICYRVEMNAGKPVFIAASSADGSIHDQMFAKEMRRFPGAPFHWIMFKNVVKSKGATEVGPGQFLASIHDAFNRAVPGKAAGVDGDAEFVERLWREGLRLKETRQMMDKIKYVKDWGDLTASVCVQISVSAAKVQERIAAAKEELAASTPGPGSRRSSNASNAGSDASSPAGFSGGRRGSEPLNRTSPKVPLPRQASHGQGARTSSPGGLLDVSGLADSSPSSLPGSPEGAAGPSPAIESSPASLGAPAAASPSPSSSPSGPTSPSSSYDPSSPASAVRRPFALGLLGRTGSGGSPGSPFVLPRSGSGGIGGIGGAGGSPGAAFVLPRQSSGSAASSPGSGHPAVVPRSGSGSIRVPIIDAKAHALAAAAAAQGAGGSPQGKGPGPAAGLTRSDSLTSMATTSTAVSGVPSLASASSDAPGAAP
eukprot:tig00021254_g19718.t1